MNSGNIIQRTHNNSIFVNVHHSSQTACRIFDKQTYNDEPIKVLQVMWLAGGVKYDLVIEFVKESEYKIVKEESRENNE